jgi:rubrerythrin
MTIGQFYLQDSRTYVGNDIVFWATNGNGYTTDVSKAEVYSKDDAVMQHRIRETDIPWPKEYIDARTRPAVDMQYCKKADALKGTGIELIEPRRPKRDVFNCIGCGKFISEQQIYGPCPHCGEDNRP